MGNFLNRSNKSGPKYRVVAPNHSCEVAEKTKYHPNREYASNRIKTTKYSVITFLPKNLFEQFHRFANLYFLMVVALNWVPQVQAFGKEIAMVPIVFVLTVTAVKDAFEDFRRYKSDKKVNGSICRVYSKGSDGESAGFQPRSWYQVHVGDIIHLSCNEIIPADLMLLKSSDKQGICHVETMNLDGETNLKQRQAVTGIDYGLSGYKAGSFKYNVECERPNAEIYKFTGKIKLTDNDADIVPVNQNNMLLRGCIMRNTDWIEGLVVYAGQPLARRMSSSRQRLVYDNNSRGVGVGHNRQEASQRTQRSTFLQSNLQPPIRLKAVVVIRQPMIDKLLSSRYAFPPTTQTTEPSPGRIIAYFQCWHILPEIGHETKSMMNNRNPRYKRSKLERALNRDVIWCVIILLFLCFFCAAGSALWLGQYEDSTRIMFIPYESTEQFNPFFQAFVVFFTYIIIFQSVIPLPLYVSLEIIKLLQIFFINSDKELYHEGSNKRIECRALNITEDLGQVEYIFSDKTGTLTENQMEFKSCTINGKNYPHAPEFDEELASETGSRYSLANISRNSSVMENLKLETEIQRELSSMCLRSIASVDISLATMSHRNQVQEFFLLMAICNTVVVSLHEHEDPMDDEGHMASMNNSMSQISNRTNLNHNNIENPVERYTRLPDGPPSHRLPPMSNGSGPPGTGKKPTNKPLPPIGPDGEMGSQTPFNAAQARLSLDSLPGNKLLSTPTGSIAGSIGGSSMCSDMSRTRYEAESPDELALVRAASTYNCCLKGRTAKSVTVWLPADGEVEFEVLHVLTFDSTRKRMSVIVKHPTTKDVTLYTKGADSAVLSVLARKYKEEDEFIKMKRLTEEHIMEYAMQGLRTLCMAKKAISKAEYEKWLRLHMEAETSLENREEKLIDSACSIESELELIGATGIEDKLQEGVPETIAKLREAGIKVWVLTGDKQETAIQIAYSSQLFTPDQQLIMVNAESMEETHDLMKHHIEQIAHDEKTPRSTRSNSASKAQEYGLVIDGKTMTFALSDELEKIFLLLAGKCNSVICCRSSPIQKGMVVKLARDELKVLTLAIGDGANDVSMIHMADVGIGISGQEGMQAVMASDFAIGRFYFLERLLLVHGHWCYSRLARFSAFMFYKSLMSTLTLFWFNLYSGYSGATHIDSLFLMCTHVLFVAFPPIVNGILDKDLLPHTLLNDPDLYKIGPLGQTYTRLSFLIVFLDSIWQSVAVHFCCYFGYYQGIGVWEYGTTMMVSMILSILFHSAIETHRWMWPQWLTIILSFFVFWLFGIIIDSIFFTFDHPVTPYWVMQNTISKPIHAIIVVVSVVTAMLPRICVRSLQQTVFPDQVMRAQQKEKADRERFLEHYDDSRMGTPDSSYDNKTTGYENKGLDMRGDTTSDEPPTSLPEVGHRNGKVRQRSTSRSNSQSNGVAETPT